jgi:exopolysaccharide biosynthesis protein
MKYDLNKQLAKINFLVSVLCVLCASVVNLGAQDFKTLSPGVEYAEVTKEISGLNVNMNLLRLDLKKVRLDVVHAKDAAIGTETTSAIATKHGAFAAINSGFFRLDKSQFLGDPVGMMIVDGKFLSEATNDRIQLLIDNKPARTEIAMGRATLIQCIKFGAEILHVAGIDRELKNDDLVIYTPEFGNTTLASSGAFEVVVIKGNIASMSRDLGNTIIPRNGFVVSASGTFIDKLADMVKKNSTVTLRNTWNGLPPELMKDRAKLDVIAGAPQLIKNGKIDITWEQEKQSKSFVDTRHPRTAVAKLKDGKFLMITVDGRTESSGGIGLQDLAEYLLSLGATDAMNLDGGGSTTMFVDGKVVNHPSDKEGERKVSDALLVTPRTKTKK